LSLLAVLAVGGLALFISPDAMPPRAEEPKKKAERQVSNLLLIERQPPFIVFRPAEAMDKGAVDEFRRVQAILVKSRPVLIKAVRDPNVADLKLLREQANPIGWLERQIKVKTEEGGALLRVTMKGHRTDEMEAIVNAVTSAYLNEIVFKEHSKRLQRLRTLANIYDKYEKNLREKRRILRTLAESAGSGDDKQMQLSQLRLQGRLQGFDRALADLERQLRKVRVAQAGAKARLALQEPRHPERAARTKEDLAALAAEEKQLRQEMTQLEERIGEAAMKAKTINQSSLELVSLRDDVKQLEKIFDRVAAEKEALKIELDAPEPVTLLEDAHEVKGK
jgi:hypothetical protein